MPGYVFGPNPTLEPECFERETRSWHEPCPKCPAQAFAWRYEVAEGAINSYRRLRCASRGHFEGELSGDPDGAPPSLWHARAGGAGPLARRASQAGTPPAHARAPHQTFNRKGSHPCPTVLQCQP